MIYIQECKRMPYVLIPHAVLLLFVAIILLLVNGGAAVWFGMYDDVQKQLDRIARARVLCWGWAVYDGIYVRKTET